MISEDIVRLSLPVTGVTEPHQFVIPLFQPVTRESEITVLNEN